MYKKSVKVEVSLILIKKPIGFFFFLDVLVAVRFVGC